MARGSMNRKIIFSLIMFAFVCVCVLVLSEVLLRLSRRVTTESAHTASEQDFDRIPGVFEPDQDVVERPRTELVHHVAINSLGYRGPEIPRRKEPKTLRILCLGDSFTYGSYVSNNETFPYYLQRKFSENHLPVEVINGGLGDTTIVDHLYLLRRSMQINPDIVVLTFSENDISDLGKAEPTYVSLSKNRKLKSNIIIGPLYKLFRNTALFNFLLTLKGRYSQLYVLERGSKSGEELGRQGKSEGEMLWKKYEEQLKQMQLFLDEHSVYFMFAIFPSDHRIGKRSMTGGPHADRLDRIEKLANNLSIPTLNLLEPLQEAGLSRNELYLLPYDGHPSKVAYSVVANTIFEYVQDNVRGILTEGDTNGKSN